MKKVVLIVFLFLFKGLDAQVDVLDFGKSKDTTFYSTGQIKSIIYENNKSSIKLNQALFRESCDSLIDCGSLYYHISQSNNRKRITSVFEKSLITENSTHRKSNNYGSSLLINADRASALLMSFTYSKKDSLLVNYAISKPKTNELTPEKNYLYNYFTIPTEFNIDFEMLIGEDANLHIFFKKKSKLDRVYFTFSEELTSCYYFYNDNQPKEYGIYKSDVGRFGKWYSFYEDGSLKNEGKYIGSKIDDNWNEYDLVKDGEWIYYSNQGCVTKIEYWNKGILKD